MAGPVLFRIRLTMVLLQAQCIALTAGNSRSMHVSIRDFASLVVEEGFRKMQKLI